MTWRLGLLGLLVLPLACSSGTLQPTGTAGTTGTGATGGDIAGAGGTGLPACGDVIGEDSVSMLMTEPDGTEVAAVTAAAVTVASVESCFTVSCPYPAIPEASKLTLAGNGQRQWALYLLNPNMPSDYIKAGDAFDLKIDASPDDSTVGRTNQTITLSRGGDLIVFAASRRQVGAPPVPNLAAAGIAIADFGADCEEANSPCARRFHSARLTVGNEGARVASGQTVTIGGLSFTNGTFLEYGSASVCDLRSATVMAGFRLP